MSFIMDLPPDVETRLQALAIRQGVPPSDMALRLIERGIETALPDETAGTEAEKFSEWVEANKSDATGKEAARIAAIHAAFGSMAYLGGGMVEELHRERQADKAKEEAMIAGFTS